MFCVIKAHESEDAFIVELLINLSVPHQNDH